MKYVLYLILALLGLLVILLLIALCRTLLQKPKTVSWETKADPAREERYAKTLSRMVQYETVSTKGQIQREKFLGFHKVLAELFPLVHKKL